MAVLLTWVLFLVWGFVGLAVLRLGGHRWKLGTLLLAPAVGFAALTVPTYAIVRFGVPVRPLAAPVTGLLLAAAGVALWRGRPGRERARGLCRQGWPFALVLAAAFGLTGWPLFQYGFDWVANGNDDMANYCLLAAGYRDHGYAAVPTLDELREGRDATQAYWFLFILLQMRPGSEVLLAQTSALTGLPTQQVFMPATAALNLALVAAASGLAWLASRRGALLTGALLAVAAPVAYGVVQQLIAQVAGLALLCASLALVCGRFRRLPAGAVLRRACACGVAFAGLVVFYPEVTPILVGGCVVLGVRDLVTRRLDRRHLAHAALAILVMVALLPVYMYGVASFIRTQAGNAGTGELIVEIFPYFLTPRGPAILWGLLPVAGPESPDYQNASILLGLLLLAVVLAPAAANARRGRVPAAVLGVVALMGGALLAQRAAFGLFKLAMFAQPFLWGVLATWAAARRGRWAARGAAVLVAAVAAMNARTQFWYVEQSRGRDYRVELPVTGRRALSEFRGAYARRAAGGGVDRVLLATNNSVLAKLLSAEVRGTPLGQLGYTPLTRQAENGLRYVHAAPWVRLHREWAGPLESMRADFFSEEERGRLTVLDPDTGKPLHRLMHPSADAAAGAPDRVLVVGGGGSLSVLNRRQFPEAGPAVVCSPLSELHNFAAFCDATGARQDFFGNLEDPRAVSLHRLERDPAFPRRTLAGAGRAVVLDVLNPSPRVRVVVDYTASFKSDPRARALAPAQVVGDRRAALGTVGSGAARLVSPPLATQAVGPARFVVVDFGPHADRNPNHLAGVDRLWGAELPRDRRWLTGHVRDISVISDEEYAAFRPPQSVSNFPADLLHPHLEYSGLFEEGWVGAESRVRLTQLGPGQECVVRGMVPGLPGAADFRTELTVLIDGAPAGRRVLGPGEFELRVPGGAGGGPRWVELRFSQTQVLPAPDGRTCAAHIRHVGFEPRNEALSRPPERLAAFPADLSHPRLECAGVQGDGWVGASFRARLTQATPGAEVVFRGHVPDAAGGGAFRTELVLLVDGQEVARRALGPGDFELRAPAGKTAQARWVECRFTDTQVLPPPDGRRVGAHIRFLGFEPPRQGPYAPSRRHLSWGAPWPPPPRLSLVIPAYNEVATIQRTLRAVRDYLEPRGFDYELIVAADGTDGTREAAAALVSEMPVAVVGEPARRGKGRGVREGVLAATGELVGFLDADYKVAIDEIEKVLPWFGDGYDVVIGSRAAAGADIRVSQPWYRRMGSKGFALLMRPLVGLHGIADTQCGFKFFRGEVARDLFSRQRIDGYMFDVEVLSLALRAGYRVKEVGVCWRDDGDTRLELVSGNWKNLKDLFRIRFGRRAARASSNTGVAS